MICFINELGVAKGYYFFVGQKIQFHSTFKYNFKKNFNQWTFVHISMGKYALL